MKRIDLNCDMGESFGAYTMGMNKKVMANIACGFHAGNPMVMGGTVSLALEKKKKRGHRCPPRLPGPAGIRRRPVKGGNHAPDPGSREHPGEAHGEDMAYDRKIFDKPVCRLTEDILDAHAVCRPAGYRATRFLLKKSTCPRPTGFIRRFGKNRQR